MTVQDIANAVSSDQRQVLSADTADINVIIPWIDRTHKDALHTSLFNSYIRANQTVNVVAGTATYSLTPPQVRRITSVYDRTFDRTLKPYESLLAPAQPGLPGPSPDATMIQWPLFFMQQGANTVMLYPAPQKALLDGAYEVYYEQTVPDLVLPTDTLLIPNDGKDLMVAGVNALASQYLKNFDEANMWRQQYQAMKTGSIGQ